MDKVAIIGMGCLFPDYSNSEKFWHTIVNGGNFLRRDKFLDRTIERGGMPFSGTKFFADYFSKEEHDEFESYGELYKWCAYIVDESLKDAKYTSNSAKLKRTGLIVGTVGQTTCDQIDFLGPFVTKNLEREINQIVEGDRFKYTFTPQHEKIKTESILADTRPIQYIANKRGIEGPVLSFNAACASPLYAIKIASSYLSAGEADMVIAGSQCYNETIGGIFGLFSKFGILCNVGESIPLDKNSKGLIPGSGAGLFVLKRLEDAMRDEDRILAVIENIGWSNDGDTSSGIMTPSTAGQIKALESAYENGISKDIDYIECHATGTEAGDRVEIKSIEEFFGFDYIDGPKTVAGRPLLGGLKGSTGHFFTATASASIAKVILAMEHEVIPSTVAIENPLCEGLVLENTPWKKGDKPRRAGVNAFGFGGINAHLVLSEYEPQHNNIKGNKRKTENRIDNKVVDNTATELAITGMGLRVGSFESVEDFLEGLLKDKNAFNNPDENRFRGYDKEQEHLLSHGFEKLPKGSYINKFRFDAMRFKMPFVGNPFFLRRDMLLLETAAEALDMAGINRGEAPRTAVIAHSAPDYTDPLFMATYEIDESIRLSLKESYPELTDAQRNEILNIMRDDEAEREHADNVPGMIGNIRGNRISAHWGFFGPSFTVLESETSVFRCIELARFFLSEGIVDQVVVAISSFSGEFEHLYVQKELGFMDVMEERGIAEGAVVFVLKAKDKAIKDKDNIFSVINGVALSAGLMDKPIDVDDVLDKVLQQSKVEEKVIQAIEVPTSYSAKYEEIIEKASKDIFGKFLDKEIVTSNVERYLGFGFSLSAASSIIRHTMQLYLSRIFGSGVKEGKNVFRKALGDKKAASLITGYNQYGNFGSALISEYCNGQGKREDKLLPSRFVPIPVPFDSKESLLDNLRIMEESITKKSTIIQLYKQFWDNYESHSLSRTNENNRAVVVLCDSKDTLRLELVKAKEIWESDSINLSEGEKLSSFSYEPFFQEESTDTSVALFSSKFGLSAELSRHLGLGESTALFQPTNYLLNLSAKLMFEGIEFDYNRFFGNFDFYILKQPSYIRDISTGMPELPKRVDSPENRRKLANIKEQLKKESRVLLSNKAVPSFGHSKELHDADVADFYENKYLFKPELRLIDEVLSADYTLGVESLGTITAKLEIKPNHPITEKNACGEIVVSKSLLNYGVDQLNALFSIGRGYLDDKACVIEVTKGKWSYVNEHIIASDKSLRYELTIKSIQEKEGTISVISDCEIHIQGEYFNKVRNKQFIIKYSRLHK